MVLEMGRVRPVFTTGDLALALAYNVYDEFTTALTAGNVNGSEFDPVGQGYTRNVTDTTPDDIAIVDGEITITGTGTLSQQRYLSDVDLATDYPREYGLTYIFKVNVPQTTGMVCCGVRDTGSGYWGLQFTSPSTGNPRLAVMINTIARLNYTLNAGDYGTGDYIVTIVLRANGAFVFIQGGNYSATTLLYPGLSGSNNVYPFVEAYGSGLDISCDYWRLAKALTTVTPLASDSFDRASMSTTDGAGHPEANGGDGLTWTDQVGTWGITSNKARALTLSGNHAVTTVDVGKTDVVIEGELTSNGDYIGFTLRYVDANNYISARITPAIPAVRLFKIVGGSETQVATASFTYSAGARMVVVADGSDIRLMYNNATLVAGTVSDAVFDGVTKHGLYAHIAGSVVNVDNFVIWARD